MNNTKYLRYLVRWANSETGAVEGEAHFDNLASAKQYAQHKHGWVLDILTPISDTSLALRIVADYAKHRS